MLSAANVKLSILPWVSYGNQSLIALSTEVLASSIRLPILVKEVSQLYDNLDYCRVYLSVMQGRGVQFMVQNQQHVATSENETIAAVAHELRKVEEETLGHRSLLVTLVDTGSALRVGGILFATWYLDQLNRKITVPNDSRWAQAGHQIGGFLQDRGLIRQQGDIFVWTKGKAPEIISPELLSLVFALTPVPLPF